MTSRGFFIGAGFSKFTDALGFFWPMLCGSVMARIHGFLSCIKVSSETCKASSPDILRSIVSPTNRRSFLAAVAAWVSKVDNESTSQRIVASPGPHHSIAGLWSSLSALVLAARFQPAPESSRVRNGQPPATVTSQFGARKMETSEARVAVVEYGGFAAPVDYLHPSRHA